MLGDLINFKFKSRMAREGIDITNNPRTEMENNIVKNIVNKDATLQSAKVEVNIVWIPIYMDIPGNERTDKLGKIATSQREDNSKSYVTQFDAMTIAASYCQIQY